MFYRNILKPILFRFDPEKVHNLFVWLGEMLGRCGLGRQLTRLLYGYKGKDISKVVDNIKYKTPFLLSAGFDYNGRLLNILPEISFGGEEIGSVTARPCEGNKKPRLKRLPKSKSLLINKGLKNDGVEKIIERLKLSKGVFWGRGISKTPFDNFVVGISIAQTNDKNNCSAETGLEDYFYSFKRLSEENIGDYYTINISCPNAFGGEVFTDPVLLERLLAKISQIKCDKPVYIKMPINLSWPDFDALLKISDKFQMIKGIIIGNLNKEYDSLDFRGEAPKEYKGGLSGKPCFEPSNELIKKTRAAYGKRFTIIGCGGVMSVDDMIKKFEAGSDLVMLITGIIFNGPGFVKELAEAYSKHSQQK